MTGRLTQRSASVIDRFFDGIFFPSQGLWQASTPRLFKPVIFGILALTSFTLSAEQEKSESKTFDVEKRIYHKETATTMSVKRFDLSEAVDLPKKGLKKQELVNLIERKRKEYKGQFNIDSLQEITGIITQYYRQAGFVLVTAYIPEQDVNNGVVKIGISYGIISNLKIEGNGVYNNKTLTRPFEKLFDRPAQAREMETAMLFLNDYPGYSAKSIFAPGEKFGTSTILLNTEKESRYQGNIAYDNYGSQFTGENRVRLALNVNNMANRADKLNLNLVQTVNPANSFYGGFTYAIPVWKPQYSVGFGFNKNSYEVGDIFTPLEIEGDSDSARAFAQAYWIRNKAVNLYSILETSSKSAASQSGVFSSDTDDSTTVTSLGIGFDGDDPWLTGKHGGRVIVYSGSGDSLTLDDTIDEDSFTKATLGYQHAFPLGFVEQLRNTYLLVKLNMQFTSDTLTSLEQFSLGGPHSVRAYPVSEFLVDRGRLLSVEWVARGSSIADYPWLEKLQLALFFDHAYGKLNEIPSVPEEQGISLNGFGFSAQSMPGKGVQVRFDIGIPLGGDPFENYQTSNGKSAQTFFTVGYQL